MAEHAHTTPTNTTSRRPLGAAVIAAIGVAFTRPATSAIVTIGRSQCDAELLALRDHLRAAVDGVNASEMAVAPSDEWLTETSDQLDDVCRKIVDAPAALTAEGRVLKAAAAMYQLRFSYSLGEWQSSGEELAWRVLSEIAGDAYVPPMLPEAIRANDEPRRA